MGAVCVNAECVMSAAIRVYVLYSGVCVLAVSTDPALLLAGKGGHKAAPAAQSCTSQAARFGNF